MTWRDLLSKLASLDKPALDLPVYVCMNNGGDLEPVSSLETWYLDCTEIDDDNVMFLDLSRNKIEED